MSTFETQPNWPALGSRPESGILLRMATIDPLEALTNYYPISPLILTAGQPTAKQIALIRQAGCQVVINLAMPASTNALPDEAALVAAQGMEYVAIPVVWEEPALDDLARFFAAMEANRERKVFVHCVVNYRVSAFMYLHRVLRLGVDPEEAIWDLRAIWEPEAQWAEFIDFAIAQDKVTANPAMQCHLEFRVRDDSDSLQRPEDHRRQMHSSRQGHCSAPQCERVAG